MLEERQLAEVLWRTYDRYRGTLDSAEFRDVLLVLTFLRAQPTWKALIERRLDVEHALLADLPMRDASVILSPLLTSVHKVEDASGFAPFVDLLAGRHLDNQAIRAKVFSALLEVGPTGPRGGEEFHTPVSITELASALLDPKPGDRILDPACKSGGFPAAMADRLIGQGKALDRLVVDISDYSPRSSALAYLNMRVRGIAPRVLSSPVKSLPTGVPDGRYDIVTANPPFNLSAWDNDRRFSGLWPYGIPPGHNANFAWLQYAVAGLDEGGRAAVVMSHNAGLSENGQEKNIRAALLDGGTVSAVIALPGQLFGTTDIPVTLWLMQAPSNDRPREVLFVDAGGLGSVRQRGRRTLTEPDIGKIVDAYSQWRDGPRNGVEGLAIPVSIEQIRADGYRLNPRAYVLPADAGPTPHSRAKHVSELAERLHVLSERAQELDRTIEIKLKEFPPWRR